MFMERIDSTSIKTLTSCHDWLVVEGLENANLQKL